jgi:hypothetical protein
MRTPPIDEKPMHQTTSQLGGGVAHHKKTQTELLIECFERHGWKATLGELLDDGRYSFAHKLTARLSDLRREGYTIVYTKGKTPSQNLYEILTEKQRSFHFEDTN